MFEKYFMMQKKREKLNATLISFDSRKLNTLNILKMQWI